jgi:hypothetical protein
MIVSSIETIASMHDESDSPILAKTHRETQPQPPYPTFEQ